MKRRNSYLAFVFSLAFISSSSGQAPPSGSPAPTWKELSEQGIVPYRQLTVADFPVDDSVHANFGFFIKPAIQPRYHFAIKPHGSFAYAYVDQWLVFSGFDKRETSRRSKFKAMKEELPYAQALLDISELHARQIAALKTGELPNARGGTFQEADAELRRKMNEFIDARFAQAKAEMEAFAKETKNGADKKKVKQRAAEIRKRLTATPVTTAQPTDVTSVHAAPSGSPAAVATASPAPSPSPPP